ncbi:MAG: hypothetical protein ACRDOO_21460 [Actinomadura sp.]
MPGDIHELIAWVPTTMSSGRRPISGIGATASKVAVSSMQVRVRKLAEQACWARGVRQDSQLDFFQLHNKVMSVPAILS